MAQAITNTVQSTNPLAGLLGLNPKPLATSAFGSGVAATTPAVTSGLLAPKPVVPAPKVAANWTGSSGVVPQTPASPSYAQAPTGQTVNSGGGSSLFTPNGTQVNADGSVVGNPASTNTSVRGLFPNVVSSLAGLQNNYGGLATKAQDIASNYGEQIANAGDAYQRAAAGYQTTGTTPVAEGNANVALNTASNITGNLAKAEEAALQGVGYGITANQGAASALGAAGNLAQPQVTAYGQTSFDPTSGTFAGGSNGGLPAEVMQQYAQMAVNGNYSAIPSFITGNPVLNAQLNVAAKALNSNYSPVGAQGASEVIAGIPALQSANTAAEGIKNTIQSYLQSNPSLNPSDLAAGNLLQQWIQGKQLTDPKYQTLFNYLNEYTNTLAPILGVGGDPTNLKTQIAQGFINAAASGQSITQVLQAMSQLATHKITDLQSGAVGGGTTVPNTTGGSTGGFAETW